MVNIEFDQILSPHDIKKFRSAVIENTNRKSDLFHNHNEKGNSLKRYPLIQYKTINNKAAIICLDNGTDDIHYLLQQKELSLRIGAKKMKFSIDRINMYYFNFQTWKKSYRYHIRNWIPLNQNNYQRFVALQENSKEEKEFLEQVLAGHILGMATGIGWQTEERITVKIEEIKSRSSVKFKNINFIGFKLIFNVNVSLPNYIGLGKGTSLGYGLVRKLNERRIHLPISNSRNDQNG